MKIGDKVKHINTGDKIHTIKSINKTVCTCILDETMWHPLTTDSKSSVIVDVMICKLENLILSNLQVKQLALF